MEIIALGLFAVFAVSSLWLQYKQAKYLSYLSGLAKTTEKSNSPQVMSSPNQLPGLDPNEIEFDENVPMAIPPNVKFEVEGGDSIAPPGFQDGVTTNGAR